LLSDPADNIQSKQPYLRSARAKLDHAMTLLPGSFPYDFRVSNLCGEALGTEQHAACEKEVRAALPLFGDIEILDLQVALNLTGRLWREDSLGCVGSLEQLNASLLNRSSSFGGLIDIGMSYAAERDRFWRGADQLPNGKRLRAYSVMPGDYLGPSFLSHHTDGAHVQEVFDAIGLDFVTLGNHEFDMQIQNGKLAIAESMRESSFKSLTANVICRDVASCGPNPARDGGGIPNSADYQVDDFDGYRVCFFGITSDPDARAASRGRGVRFQPYTDEGIHVLKDLNHVDCSLVVALTHLNVGQDLKLWHLAMQCYQAGECPHLDVIAGSHDHYIALLNLVNPYAKHPIRRHTYYWKLGQNGHLLAKYVFDLSWQEPPRVSLVPVVEGSCRKYVQGSGTPSKSGASLQELLSHLTLRLEHHEEVHGVHKYRQHILPIVFRGRYNTANCARRETRAGNLIADGARLAYGGADVAVLTAGMMRAGALSMLNGPLTAMDMHEEFPFGNRLRQISVCLWQLVGIVMDALTDRRGAERSGQRVVLSGVEVVFDVSSDGWIASDHDFLALQELRWLGPRHMLGRRVSEDRIPDVNFSSALLDTIGGRAPQGWKGLTLFRNGTFVIDPFTQVSLVSNAFHLGVGNPIKEPTVLRLSGEVAQREHLCLQSREASSEPAFEGLFSEQGFSCLEDGHLEPAFYEHLDDVMLRAAPRVMTALRRTLPDVFGSGLWPSLARRTPWPQHTQSDPAAEAVVAGLELHGRSIAGQEEAPGIIGKLLADQRNLPEQRWRPAVLDLLYRLPIEDNMLRMHLKDPIVQAALHRQVDERHFTALENFLNDGHGHHADPLHHTAEDVAAHAKLQSLLRSLK